MPIKPIFFGTTRQTCSSTVSYYSKYLSSSVWGQVCISSQAVCVCLLQDTPPQYVSPSALLKQAARCTAAWGGCVQAESPTETTTTHIKGVPLVEHDYQPLSYESMSPPSTKASLTGMGREGRQEDDLLNTSWPQAYSCIPFVFLSSLNYFPFSV